MDVTLRKLALRLLLACIACAALAPASPAQATPPQVMPALAWPVSGSTASAVSATPVSASAANGPLLELHAPAETVRAGDAFTVRMDGIRMKELYALEAEIRYDAQLLRLEGAQQLVAGGYAGQWEAADGAAKVYLTMLGSTALNGSSPLIELRFRALRPGSASVALLAAETEDWAGERRVYGASGAVTVGITAAPGAAGGGAERPSGLVSKRPGGDPARIEYVWNADELRLALQALGDRPAAERLIEVGMEGEVGRQTVVLESTAGLLASAAETIADARIKLVIGDDLFYELPLAIFASSALAELLQIDEEAAAQAVVAIAIGPGRLPEQARAGHTFISGVYEFAVTVRLPDGREHALSRFGRHTAKRGIALEAVADERIAGGVVYNPDTGALQYVPTVFRTEQGKAFAVLERNANSAYAVISGKRTFGDSTGHWAQAEIESLASKLLLLGRSPASFVPDGNVTRAEFATLLARGLGLAESPAPLGFGDTSPSAWYAGSVSAAVEAGIVSGYPDGTFRPQTPITRQQMAVMLARALAFAGASELLAYDADILRRFGDRAEIGAWAEEAAAGLVGAGLMRGVTAERFAPESLATRAQAAVMLDRTLRAAGLLP